MKKALLFFIFSVLSITICNSQVAIFKSTAFVDSVSQPGIKKFGFKHSFDGINVPVIYKTVDVSAGTVYYGDSVPNLLNSNSSQNDITNKLYICYAISAYNSNDVYQSGYNSPTSQNIVSFPNIVVPGGTNCNGSIGLYRDQGNGPVYDISWNYDPTAWYNFSSFFGGNPLPMPNGYMGNLCSRIYRVGVPYDCVYKYDGHYWYMQTQESFIVLLGEPAFPSSTGLNVVVNPYQQTTSPLCDGKAKVNVTNSNSSFLYSFDSGAYSVSDSISNLCEGMHTVKVKNATDSISKYFIVSNSINVFNNPNVYGPVVDTIIYNLTNCNFNYNAPVDSAFLLNFNQIDTNTISLSWQIWQAGILTSVTDTISYLYQTGTSMVSLMVFCGNARIAGTSAIKTFRINDYVYLNQTVGIKNNTKKIDFKLSPNPFSGTLNIRSTNISMVKRIEMSNFLGEKMEVIYQAINGEIVISTDNLKPGFYMISVIDKSGKETSYKVIKQ